MPMLDSAIDKVANIGFIANIFVGIYLVSLIINRKKISLKNPKLTEKKILIFSSLGLAAIILYAVLDFLGIWNTGH